MRRTAYGKRCKRWRVLHSTYKQRDIADELGCTVAYVSSFESGKADNADLMVWYLEHGMPINDLLKEGEEL